MTAIFIDTWYLIAITLKGDKSHNNAKLITEKISSRNLITSEGVLTEYLNFFSKYGGRIREAATKSVEAMKSRKQLEIVHQNHDYFERALGLYRKRTDKNYSLTDCFSMTIMKEREITEVITNDEGFTQEGFVKISQ